MNGFPLTATEYCRCHAPDVPEWFSVPGLRPPNIADYIPTNNEEFRSVHFDNGTSWDEDIKEYSSKLLRQWMDYYADMVLD